MHSQGAPWPMFILLGLFFIGNGAAWFFFADQLCEWQIRWLQSAGYRFALRTMGVFFMVVGVVITSALLLHKT